MRSKVYEYIPVELIHEKNTIRPVPDFYDFKTEIDKLRHHVGTSIAYLKDRCGSVDIPDIKIAVMDVPTYKYAVLVNGNGMYRSYEEAWSYITFLFDGIRAVYEVMNPSIKFNIPVVYGFDNADNTIGHAKLNDSRIVITLDKKIPPEIFDGLVYLSFAYLKAEQKS